LITWDQKRIASDFTLHMDSVANLLVAFAKTKLTKEEEGIFKSLNQNIKLSQALELISVDEANRKMDLIIK